MEDLIPNTPYYFGRACSKCGGTKRYVVQRRCANCTVARARRNYRKFGRDVSRNRELLKRYGISLAERDQMLAAQGGCCGVCKSRTPGQNDWHVDHDHVTGKVRGILCCACNPGIGHLDDSPLALLTAITYLGDRGKPFISTPIGDWLRANPLEVK